MRTLVIGGTGYLGSHIVERLHARGFEVTVFARGRTRAQLPDAVTTAVGDRHSRDDLLRASRRPFDAVVDVAAYRRDETQLLVDVFDGRVDRFVHISTVSANRLSSGRPLRESGLRVRQGRVRAGAQPGARQERFPFRLDPARRHLRPTRPHLA
jgi:nucleoside-diphosphate-sugar epimerase